VPAYLFYGAANSAIVFGGFTTGRAIAMMFMTTHAAMTLVVGSIAFIDSQKQKRHGSETKICLVSRICGEAPAQVVCQVYDTEPLSARGTSEIRRIAW
jgi:hypothetical protein